MDKNNTVRHKLNNMAKEHLTIYNQIILCVWWWKWERLRFISTYGIYEYGRVATWRDVNEWKIDANHSSQTSEGLKSKPRAACPAIYRVWCIIYILYLPFRFISRTFCAPIYVRRNHSRGRGVCTSVRSMIEPGLDWMFEHRTVSYRLYCAWPFNFIPKTQIAASFFLLFLCFVFGCDEYEHTLCAHVCLRKMNICAKICLREATQKQQKGSRDQLNGSIYSFGPFQIFFPRFCFREPKFHYEKSRVADTKWFANALVFSCL